MVTGKRKLGEAHLSTEDDSSDSGDLLGRLDVERRKELNRNRVRRFRQRKQQSAMMVGHHVDAADVLRRVTGERKVAQRLRRQRQFETQGRQADKDTHHHNTFDNELSADERAACLERLRKDLGAEGLDECVCVSCDRLVLRKHTRRVEDTDLSYLQKMKKLLSVDTTGIPEELVNMFCPPRHLTVLSGASVSPRGIQSYTGDDSSMHSWMSVCSECDKSIQRGKLSKFAIGNGFFVGCLSKDLLGLTIPERLMTQLAHITALTRVMRGGRHRCIRSHCIAFDCKPGPPVCLLPRMMNNVVSYRVLLVGEFTTPQAAQVRRMHRVRQQEVRDLFAFYMQHNHLYAGVKVDNSALSSEYTDDDIEGVFVEHVDDPECSLDNEMNREQESVHGESDAWHLNDPHDECRVIERRLGLVIDKAPVSPAVVPTEGKEREFEIRRSTQMANDVSKTLLARLFPHLFPFGRGNPGEDRKIHVSVEECIKHYSLLSERRFAEDELFALVAFDLISLRNMYIQNHFRCMRFPHVYEGYENLNAERLRKALLQNERRRQGCLPWRPHDDSIAERFLKSVEVGSRSIWGSNAERAQCRHKAFAYQARFGQPALFVTLTPNSDNSQVLARYTGISSVATLFDELGARLPSKTYLRKASRGNDCASARLFMRHVDAFIRHALGMDPATGKRLSYRGLFGDVKAFFGMVETQGRGTLHIHFLIWLNKCPLNSTSVENILRSPEGDIFRDSVASYAESIVQNELPITLNGYSCSNCGASFSKLKGIPIPDAARKDPHTVTRTARFCSNAAEILLIECSVCSMQCSSQHLIRGALLKSRPTHWPLWERPLTAGEIEKQVTIEGICRDTKARAIRTICERESIYLSYCKEELLHENTTLTANLLQQTNLRQQPMGSGDDDPFRNDDLIRLLEVSSPATSDARMSKHAQNYMVSALAVLLNQHLWSHTTNCFKRSAVTSNHSFCRYRFPRGCVEKTLFGSAGVELKRTLGHEYMNGFNYEIMAAFKCNHDIQVLLGGSGVTDRIHYCCKYVTKLQKQLDSQVAVAVAAFHRRQDRERNETAMEDASIPDHLARARKRVAALVYNMTNRQEVAGPLAALYLYRGSCCYASAKCATLPVGDVIRQLTMTEGYVCNLVADNASSETAHFRAVSALDDYSFRPNDLESVNLYQFTMRYFRKKCEAVTSSTLLFQSEHPLADTHCLCERYSEVVPIIQGFRFPSTGENESLEQKCKLSVLSLVLFKPFRGLEDLIGAFHCSDEQIWIERFEEWKSTRSTFVQEIMDNMSDFYSGQAKAKEQRENALKVQEVDNGDSVDNDDLFDGDDDPDFRFGDVVQEEDSDRDLHQLWEMEEATGVTLESSTVDPALCPTSMAPDARIASMMAIFQEKNLLQNAAEALAQDGFVEWPTTGLPTIDTMKKWVKNAATDNSLLLSGSCTVLLPRDTEVVELLDQGLLETNMRWHPISNASGEPKLSKSFSNIAEVSRLYTLNERQHYAFKAIAKALLKRWRRAEMLDNFETSLQEILSKGQLLMFLGGEGGTGKSRIVAAVQAICASWGRRHSVITTALTGKAATLIGGRTLTGFCSKFGRNECVIRCQIWIWFLLMRFR